MLAGGHRDSSPKSYRAYLRKELRDPRGSPYGYAWPSETGGELPEIFSLGGDATDGTGDEIYMFDEEEVGAV